MRSSSASWHPVFCWVRVVMLLAACATATARASASQKRSSSIPDPGPVGGHVAGAAAACRISTRRESCCWPSTPATSSTPPPKPSIAPGIRRGAPSPSPPGRLAVPRDYCPRSPPGWNSAPQTPAQHWPRVPTQTGRSAPGGGPERRQGGEPGAAAHRSEQASRMSTNSVEAAARRRRCPNKEMSMMQRVVVDRYGGPEVLRVVEEDDPRPGPGEGRVRMLVAGVSFTDAQLRAGTYMGGPKPPFTPGYELVGVVEELGPGCSRLRQGDRVAALNVWGAYAERVCVPEVNAVEVPEDLDPAEVVSLVLPYMTAYQLLHRTAQAKRRESVLVHGAAGRVGSAVLE